MSRTERAAQIAARWLSWARPHWAIAWLLGALFGWGLGAEHAAVALAALGAIVTGVPQWAAARLDARLVRARVAGGTPLVTHVQCPCGEAIAVPIAVSLPVDADGRQSIALEPDLADLWAHAWICASAGGAFPGLP